MRWDQFSNTGVLIAALLVVALTFLIYSPALQNDFVNWDDDKYVYENQNIRSFDFKFLKWSFGFHILNWHPLTFISHSVDYALWGLNPIGHHLSSIVFHGINTFIFYILILYLLTNIDSSKSYFSQTNDKTEIRNIFAATIASLLFGIHPIHVESVAWISERKDVLSAFFVLLCLIFYCKYVINQKPNKQSFHYILSLIFFILALMSKPMAATLPIVLIILDIYPFQRFSFKEAFTTHKKVIMEKMPFFFFSLIVTILTVMAQHLGGAIVSLKSYPLSFRIAVAIKGLSFYLEKMIFPINLSPFYPLPKSIPFLSFEYIFPIILVTLISIFCVWTWKRGRKVFTAVWAYYIVTLLPAIGIIQLGEQAAADRYSYIPTMGPFLLIGLGISLAWEKIHSKGKCSFLSKIAFFILLFFILFKLSVMTSKQIAIWSDSITLWNHVIKTYPDLWLAHYNRAHAYTSLGDYQQALKDLDKVIQYKPKYTQAYYIRAINYIRLGYYQRALMDFDSAIKYKSDFAEAYYFRSYAYTLLGDYQRALKDLDKVIELRSEFIQEAYRDKREIHKKLDKYQ